MFHSKGYLHRDIKPDNFTMGVNKNEDTVYLVDYGLAKPYLDFIKGNHIPFSDDKRLTGTARYASINAHLGYEQGRRDDLESLGYTLIYLHTGSLPWQSIKGLTKKERRIKIGEKKIATKLDKLCKDLPTVFLEYFKYVKSLTFEAKPNYAHLRKLFKNCFIKKKFNVNFEFDWKKPKQPEAPQRATSYNNVVKLVEEENKDNTHKQIPKQNVIQKNLSCNLLLVNPDEFQYKVINELQIPVKASPNHSVTNDSNIAERDISEDNGTYNLEWDDINETSNSLINVDDEIPIENPIRAEIKVPIFKCSDNFGKLSVNKKVSSMLNVTVKSKILSRCYSGSALANYMISTDTKFKHLF